MRHPPLMRAHNCTGAAPHRDETISNEAVPTRNRPTITRTKPVPASPLHRAQLNHGLPNGTYLPARYPGCDSVCNWLCLPYTFANSGKGNTVIMKYQRVKAGFIRYSDARLLVAAGRILQCMKNSHTFTDPRPPLAEIEAAFEDYRQKVYAAAGGGLFYNTAKRESKRRLADLLQKLALYVNMVSDGHLPKLYSSGFPVLERRRKGQSPNTPGQPFLRDGRKSGEVAFGFKPVGRDMFYDYCFATETDKRGHPQWGELRTTTRSWTDYADGFTPGCYVYFRVRARNKHGVSNWTQPIRFAVR